MFGTILPYLLVIAPVGMLYLASHFLYLNKQSELKSCPVDEHHVRMMRLRLDTANKELALDGTTTLTGQFGVTSYLQFYHVRVLGLWLCIATSLLLLAMPIVHAFAHGLIALAVVLAVGTSATVACYRRYKLVHGHGAVVLCLMIAGIALGGIPPEAYHALWISLVNNVPMLYIAFARNADKSLRSDWRLQAMTVVWLVGHVASLLSMLGQFNIKLQWSWEFLSYGKQISLTLLALTLVVLAVWLRTRQRASWPVGEVVMEAAPVSSSSKESVPLPYVDGKTPLDLAFKAQNH